LLENARRHLEPPDGRFGQLDAGSAGVIMTTTPTSRDLTAADAMSSPVVTVPDSGTIWDAWSVLINYRVRHAVVVSHEHCVGVIDDRELVRAWQQGPSVLRATPVRLLLRDRTSSVLPGAALSQVAALMNTEQIDAVPVVDASGKLLGLITAGDVLHTVAQYGLHNATSPDEAHHEGAAP
jgi:CBS domain-containing protein